ncbi:MAG TPA: alpha-1,4-glucan--maltose-1-phosphate maltosyltransferase [Usitatibacteraceae bacterium]|nr:alpha-1,4-glucan--maltose-1-phosphate maltosyltransferase [Usitatibacteraceae bacterium]
MAERNAPKAQADGRLRAVIETITPSVDGGRFPAKRIEGETVVVEADCFTDGHDGLRARLLWRAEDEKQWQEMEMRPLVNDRWRGSFVAGAPGRYRYAVCAWVDHFESWRNELARREDPEDILIAALVGAELIGEAAGRAAGADRKRLQEWSASLRAEGSAESLKTRALDEPLAALANRYPDRSLTTCTAEMPLEIDRALAGFGAWYELFPRSASPTPGRHGTFRDVEKRLPYVAELGFDVLYLPPIHPIGREKRKGRNNALATKPGDVGSPWAIGATEGGHTAVHPDLGSPADFRRLVAKAKEHGIEIALDLAYQCAPDHPWVKEHPSWFRSRPDGTVQYAENPPKKYQDIYPFHFESGDWRALWEALKGVVDFWIGEGVRIFRVDNPHTKSFAFWAWMIPEVKRAHPDVIFLAEAFTRPRVMHRLAKVGFSQSYTYFTWRNTAAELTQYFTELSRGPGRDYFRPNAWPNTPDILPESLQYGGRTMFVSRLVLAATLSANYGIYGPAYELMDNRARSPGTEEYLDSEKYELRHWDLENPESLRAIIAMVNRIRRENPALHANESLRFMPTDNEQLLCYAKSTADGSNQVIVAVNLDPHNTHTGWIELDLEALGLEPGRAFQMHDLLTGARYLWQGARNFLRLDPARTPAHIFLVRRHVHREQDFDYFL